MMLALDRATSGGRFTDIDGRLHIPRSSTITRCEVSDYLAEEIPGWESLGLKAGDLIPMLRPADELKAAAPAFDGLPLLSKHVPLTAASHRPDLVVGVILDPMWEEPDLVATLIVWDGDAIKRIEEAEAEGAGANLSCGYRYKPDMSPGVHQGVRYAGVMKNIVPNHVSMVDRGRVPGAMVGDSAPRPFIIPFKAGDRLPAGQLLRCKHDRISTSEGRAAWRAADAANARTCRACRCHRSENGGRAGP
jgi:uncharacterized protein